MRLSSKIVGAGLILSGTVLAGCNCCDSCRRNPASSSYMASKQQPGGRYQPGQPNQSPIMQTGATGQPGYGVQQSSWNYPPAGSSGRMTGNMTPGSPAIPVTGAGSSPVSSNGGYNGTLATSGAFGAQPSSFGTRTSASTGAYSAPTGSTGAYRSTTGLGAYGNPAPNYGTPSLTSPTAASGSAMTSAGSPSNSQVFNVSGSSATGQPSSTPADTTGTPSTPSNSTAIPGAGSATETPTVTKGFAN